MIRYRKGQPYPFVGSLVPRLLAVSPLEVASTRILFTARLYWFETQSVLPLAGILVQPHQTDAHFRKEWMPYFFGGKVPRSSLLRPSLILWEIIYLPQAQVMELPPITGEDLHEVATAKHSYAGGLDGWAWNEIKALSLS